MRRRLSLPVALLLVASLLPNVAAAASQGSPAPGPADEATSERLLVKFRDDAPGRSIADARRAAQAEELSTIDQLGVHVWQVPGHAAARAMQGLRRNPAVSFVEVDELIHPDELVPNDPSFKNQWGLERVNAPRAWSTTRGHAAVAIAVLDSGVTEAADLRGKLLRGYNVLDGTSNVVDNDGHGTRSASVAAAGTNNGEGIAAYCWDCSILPVKVFDTGGAYTSDIAKGMTWAADNGASVISLSMSGPNASTTMANGVRYVADRDVVLLAAAGNYSSDTPRYPAAFPEVIGVAGTTSTDALYSWSNHGDWVDVSAPGNNHAISPTGSVVSYSGTSSATPAAAGVVGLGLATGASPDQVRVALQEAAAPLSTVRFGRIDAAAMVSALGATSPTPGPEPDPPTDPEPSEPDPTEPEPEPTPKCHPRKGCDGGGADTGGNGGGNGRKK